MQTYNVCENSIVACIIIIIIIIIYILMIVIVVVKMLNELRSKELRSFVK